MRLDHDDAGEVVRVGTVVPDDRAALAVAGGQVRIDVRVRDVNLEQGPRAPALRVLGVVLRIVLGDAPIVVAAVEQDRGAVGRDRRARVDGSRERVDVVGGKCAAPGQRLDAGIVDDVGDVGRSRHLQTKRRHRVVVARPGERRRRAVHGRLGERRARNRHRPLAAEPVDERRDRNVGDAAVGERAYAVDLVFGRHDLGELKPELRRVADEPLPVEVWLVVGHDVGLGDVRPVVEDVWLRDERAHGHRLGADHTTPVDADAANRDLCGKAAVASAFAANIDDSAGRALHYRTVAGTVGQEVVRNYARGVLELNRRHGRLVPADIDAADAAVGLACGVCAVAVEVYPCLDRVETLPDAANGGLVEPEGLGPFGADCILVFELHEHAVRRKSSRLKRSRVKHKLAGHEVDGAEHALHFRLRARDYHVALAHVVAADDLADQHEVKRGVVENDVRLPVRPHVVAVVRDRALEVIAFNRLAGRRRQRRDADVRAGGKDVVAEGGRDAPVVHALLGKVYAVDRAGRGNHAARLEKPVNRRLDVEEHARRVDARADFGRAGHDKRRVGAPVGLRHCADNDAPAGNVLHLAAVRQAKTDRGTRIVLEVHLFGEILRDGVGEYRSVPCRGANLGEVRPAVSVGVLVGIIDVGIRVGVRERLLPPALHEVVVRHYLAEVLVGEDVRDRTAYGDYHVRRAREEVVGHLLADAGVALRRVKEREAPFDAVGIVPETYDVLGVVGKSVAVGIVVSAERGDSEQFLPPVGDVVAVFVGHHDIGRVNRAVRLHAAVDVDDIRLAGGYLGAVVVDERIPADGRGGIETRRVVVARVILPPVGDAVAVRVVARLLPRVGGVAVPHVRAGLRESAAHRDEVRRADKVVPDLEPAHGLVREEAIASPLDEDVGVGKAVVAVVVEDIRRIGHCGVREHELRHAELSGGHVYRAEVVGVHEAVHGTAVHERQVAHGILDPRNDVVVVVDIRVDAALVPPADEQVSFDSAARLTLEVIANVEPSGVDVGIGGVVAHRGIQDVLREARRSLRDVSLVDCARERREVVVKDELGRERRVAVVVVPRTLAVVPGVEHLVAVLRRIGEAQRLPVVLADLVACPRAVPDAHFVNIALEVFLQVVERLHVLAVLDVVREERVEVLLLRPCADQECARGATVLPVQEAVCGGRILVDHRHAVRRHKRGRRGVLRDAVQVDDEPGAVERERDMCPLVKRQRAAVDELAALGRVETRLDRVVVVEHAVHLALRIEADAEVRAYGVCVDVHRVALVGDGAVDDRLRHARLLGHHPALDRELLEEVAGIYRPDLHVARDRVRIVARQVERLAAGRIVEPERIGRLAHRRYDLHLVRRHVAVGVIAFVLLEAELIADESAEIYVARGIDYGSEYDIA